MRIKRTALVAVTLAVGVTLIAALLNARRNTTNIASIINPITLSALPVKDASKIDMRHLAEGLTPPTNKWFSGIALQESPMAIFPTPLKFSTTESSFTYSLPTPSVSSEAIIATTTESVTVGIRSASSYQVTSYDELSVSLTYKNGVDKLATVTMVAGSPYIQLTAFQPLTIDITATSSNTAINDGTFTAKSSSQAYYATASTDAQMRREESGRVMATVPANGLVSFFVLPAGQDEEILISHAQNRIQGTKVEYSVQGNNFQTKFIIQTENNNPTIFGYLPHQKSDDKKIMKYQTIYGDQELSVGTSFSYTTSEIPVIEELDLTAITPAQKDLLITTLRQEINATRYTAVDTYFSGKELYRSAQMLQLAKQLDEETIASSIHAKLKQQLTGWLSTSSEKTKQYFYYDSRMRSIVGENVSFGSEAGNDHHFHYGYFIYAAAILAAHDPEFVAGYQDEVNLLVADIANYKDAEALPLRRVFDPYFGHSWASGSSPFNDGNNQESISEALNAWTGIVLWARQTKNDILTTQARWMLSVEAQAADSYWFNIDKSKPPYGGGYNHSFASINWGGKRDNATFFSAEPNAKLGILLIPMNPTVANILPGKFKVDEHLREVIKTDYNVQFGDYLLMYQALHSASAEQLITAKAMPEALIDGANSRSYMYAWILSHL